MYQYALPITANADKKWPSRPCLFNEPQYVPIRFKLHKQKSIFLHSGFNHVLLRAWLPCSHSFFCFSGDFSWDLIPLDKSWIREAQLQNIRIGSLKGFFNSPNSGDPCLRVFCCWIVCFQRLFMNKRAQLINAVLIVIAGGFQFTSKPADDADP